MAALQPLVEACRPRGETPPRHLRRTIEAILWRHQNGAKWRSIPAELGPWWIAAQTFIRWSRLGVWGNACSRQLTALPSGPAWPFSMAPRFGRTIKIDDDAAA